MGADDVVESWRELLALSATARASGLLAVGVDARRVADMVPGGCPVYLASAYSRRVVDGRGGWNAARSRKAAWDAAAAMGRLRDHGVTAVSPIVLAHAMLDDPVRRVLRPVSPLDAAFWSAWCAPILTACAAVVVPDLPGWHELAGVLAEVEWALSRNRRVFLYAAGLPECAP